MRIFVVLICSLALASVALGAPEEKKNEQPKKKGTQTGQVSQPGGKPKGAGNQTGVVKSGEVSDKKVGDAHETKHVQQGLKNIFHSTFSEPTPAGKPAETGKAAATGKPTSAGKPARHPQNNAATSNR